MTTLILSVLALAASLFILGFFLFIVIGLSQDIFFDDIRRHKHDKKTDKP